MHNTYICSTFAVQITLIMGQSTISIRVDEKLKKSFDELCDRFGLSNTAAFTIFMKAVVRERRIPFELRAESESEDRAMALAAFERMRNAATQSSYQDMSLEDIDAIIREVRNAR